MEVKEKRTGDGMMLETGNEEGDLNSKIGKKTPNKYAGGPVEGTGTIEDIPDLSSETMDSDKVAIGEGTSVPPLKTSKKIGEHQDKIRRFKRLRDSVYSRKYRERKHAETKKQEDAIKDNNAIIAELEEENDRLSLANHILIGIIWGSFAWARHQQQKQQSPQTPAASQGQLKKRRGNPGAE